MCLELRVFFLVLLLSGFRLHAPSPHNRLAIAGSGAWAKQDQVANEEQMSRVGWKEIEDVE